MNILLPYKFEQFPSLQCNWSVHSNPCPTKKDFANLSFWVCFMKSNNRLLIFSKQNPFLIFVLSNFTHALPPSPIIFPFESQVQTAWCSIPFKICLPQNLSCSLHLMLSFTLTSLLSQTGLIVSWSLQHFFPEQNALHICWLVPLKTSSNVTSLYLSMTNLECYSFLHVLLVRKSGILIIHTMVITIMAT